MFRKILDQGIAGDNWVSSSVASRKKSGEGSGIGQTRFNYPHTKFKGEVYILTKEEGDAHTLLYRL